MSVYLPLARKYRPQKFSNVIGQDVTVKILCQAIKKNRLGSALLFTGTRGVGKTTLARILAKVLRCENDGLEPCGVCQSCKEFDSNAIDVIEMDAASHTSVDDIRDIIESCKYLPTTGKYKIYIIDEVHMLSKSAFNALLKTLEEPPAHVKFIFATTELYKIPETIISRCMRFDLKKIDINLLVQFLASICAKESVSFEENSLIYIARAAKGSIRDSLSILDQAISLSDGKLEDGQIKEMLCGVSYSDAMQILKDIFDSDSKNAIMKARELLRTGTNVGSIIRAFLEIVHKITCMTIGTNYFGNCSFSHDEELDLKTKFAQMPLSRLTTFWQILSKENETNYDEDLETVALELLIVRLCYASSIPDLGELINDFKAGRNDRENGKGDLTRRTLDAINNSAVCKPKTFASLTDEALSIFNGSTVVE